HIPGEPPVAAVAELIEARLWLADGDSAAARAVLTRLRDAQVPACPGLAQAVTVAEAETALRDGDRGRARAFLLLADGGGAARGDAVLAGAALCLAEGDFAGARQVLAPYLDGSAPATRGERAAALLAAAIA